MEHEYNYDDSDKLFEEKVAELKTTNKPKLSGNDQELLTKCQNMNVMAMLREEFERNPIDYGADDGCCPYTL